MKKIFNSRLGFTLIEILVVIAITAILSGYLASYSRSSRRQIALYIEQQKIAGLIFKAKSLAIESFVATGQGNCGYGLAMDYPRKSYGIFYYATSTASNSPKSIQCPAIKKNGKLDLGQITAFSDKTFINTSTIAFTNPSPLPDALYYVLFVPPDPQTLIVDRNGDIMPGSATVYLQTSDGLTKAMVTVNPAGQVNF